MDQNFAISQLGEMPPSDAEDEEKGIPGEDTDEDQVKLKLPISLLTLKLLKIKTIEVMTHDDLVTIQFHFITILIGPRRDRRLGTVADLLLRHHEPPGDRHVLPDPHHDLHERQGGLLVRPTAEHARLFFSNDLLPGISRKVLEYCIESHLDLDVNTWREKSGQSEGGCLILNTSFSERAGHTVGGVNGSLGEKKIFGSTN